MFTNLLQEVRRSYQPTIPDVLSDLMYVSLQEDQAQHHFLDPSLSRYFPNTLRDTIFMLKRGVPQHAHRPLRIGVFFSGGPAAGGHNVIAGIFHAAHQIHPDAQIFGFLEGPSGVIADKKIVLSHQHIAQHMNQGGFDLLGSSRTKIETQEQLASALRTCLHANLDGLVVIGGDDSNTNAALLAEYFVSQKCPTRIIGIPKTIDGDLQSADIPISFGFDSACKTYSEIIGNIAQDAPSTGKYYHFIKLMGRSASHVTLECALATQPNLALIGEEQKPLQTLISEIADLISQRHALGKKHGVILIPEGLIAFIPEIQQLLSTFNSNKERITDPSSAHALLDSQQKALFSLFPEKIQQQFFLDKDPHGNMQLSQLDTQSLLIDLTKKELQKRNFSNKFSAQEHFLGYEGRACFPTNFDATYCYALGHLAALAIRDNLTGVICAIQHLHKSPQHWTMKAIPITQLMHIETRLNTPKPVVRKTLVNLSHPPFTHFSHTKESWKNTDHYRSPGPIQFFGDPRLTDAPPNLLSFSK